MNEVILLTNQHFVSYIYFSEDNCKRFILYDTGCGAFYVLAKKYRSRSIEHSIVASDHSDIIKPQGNSTIIYAVWSELSTTTLYFSRTPYMYFRTVGLQ